MTSSTPIFDAVLADSEPDLFLAGNVFPRPVSFYAALVRNGHPGVAQHVWAVPDTRYKSKVLDKWPTINAA